MIAGKKGSKKSAAAPPPRSDAKAKASAAPPPPAGPSPEPPLPGLDAQRHAASQKTARDAEAIRECAFPGIMATALHLHSTFDSAAYKLYLERVLEDAGRPTDPIERMLLEQVCLAHFRVAQLHVGAEGAKATEAVRIYNAAAARMLGEMRRTALAVRAYRMPVPQGESRDRLKLFTAAQ